MNPAPIPQIPTGKFWRFPDADDILILIKILPKIKGNGSIQEPK
jgi:hypothetical protein